MQAAPRTGKRGEPAEKKSKNNPMQSTKKPMQRDEDVCLLHRSFE
jgi:hypothetical protein